MQSCCKKRDKKCTNLHGLAIIVVPKLQDLVSPTRHKLLTIWADVHCVDLPDLGAFELSDSTTLKGVPVGDLLVGAGG